MSTSPLLLVEVLTEEIPAWMIAERVALLETRLTELFGDYEGAPVATERIHCDATSRRLWFTVTGLAARQPDREETVKGPPESVAFKDDQPTRALDGFLKKNEAEASQVERRDGYVWINRTVAGLSLPAFVAARVPALIEDIRWPRMMRWGNGDPTWIRPIHSIVALYGSDPIELEILGTVSSNRTAGHRTRGARSIVIENAESWEDTIRREHVVARVADRVERLQEGARDLSAAVGGEPAVDPSIWKQWAYLTEYPGIVRSDFDETFLELPPEVLVTVMRVHQKQIPVREQGRLTRYFLSIIDAPTDPDGFAASGNTFVTNARFADALFFQRVDLKRDLAERLDDLSHLQFQERLGNYADKTRRITLLAEAIRSESGVELDAEVLEEASRLSKVDLTTEMVKEFTDLQGQIGGIYAKRQGRSDEVANAIYDHYLPLTLDDALPRTAAGAILSLADRIDTLAGFFLIGLQPTGSRDPFALRRAAQGVVRILLNEDGWSVPIRVERLVELGISGYDETTGESHDERREGLLEFLEERVRTVLETVHGFAYDEIAAAMSAGWSSLTDLRHRADALRSARKAPAFLSILDSARRIANITPAGFEGTIRRDLVEHEAERRLIELGELVREQIDELAAARRYHDALESFAGMAGELETFFDQVLVNVEDEKVRDNRLAILQLVGGAARRIGDVTRIVVDRKALDRSR